MIDQNVYFSTLLLYTHHCKLTVTAAYQELQETCVETAPSLSTCERWLKKFASGSDNIDDIPHSRQPTELKKGDLLTRVFIKQLLQISLLQLKLQALRKQVDLTHAELSRAQKTIQRSKKIKDVETLTEENYLLQEKLHSLEEDFRAQNDALLQELSKIVKANEELEKQVKKEDGVEMKLGSHHVEDKKVDQILQQVDLHLKRFEENLDDGIHEQEESSIPKEEEGHTGRVPGDVHQLSALVVQLKQSMRERQEMEGDIGAFRLAAEQAEHHRTELEGRLRRKQEAFLLLQKEKDYFHHESRNRLEEKEKEIVQLKGMCERLQNQLSSKLATLAEQNRKLEGIKDHEVMEEQVRDLEAKRLMQESHLQEAEERNASMKKALEEKESQLKSQQAELEQLTEERDRAILDSKDFQTQVSRLSSLAEKRKQLMDEMAKEMQKMREDAVAERNHLQDNVHHLEECLRSSQEEKTQMERWREDCKTMEELQGEMKTEMEKMKIKLEDVHKEYDHLVSLHAIEKKRLEEEHLQKISGLTEEYEREINSLKMELEMGSVEREELGERVKELQAQLGDGHEALRIQEKKSSSVMRDLKKQLHAEKKRAEKLQEVLAATGSLPAGTQGPIAEGDARSISSWSLVSGNGATIPSPTCGDTQDGGISLELGPPSTTTLSEVEQQGLLVRLGKLQQEKSILEERYFVVLLPFILPLFLSLYSRRSLFVVLLGLCLLFFVIPDVVHHLMLRGSHHNLKDPGRRCIYDRLQPYAKTLMDFDAHLSGRVEDLEPLSLYGIPGPKTYLPIAGSGQVGLHFRGFDSSLYLKKDQTMSQRIPFHPLVQISVEGVTAWEAIIVLYKQGVVKRFQCFPVWDGVADVTYVSYVHRLFPSVLVQEVKILNPTGIDLTLDLSQIGISKWDDLHTRTIRKNHGEGEHEYHILSGLVGGDDDFPVAVSIATSKVPPTLHVKSGGSESVRILTVVEYSEASTRNQAHGIKASLEKKVEATLDQIIQISAMKFQTLHALEWEKLWRSGFSLSYSWAGNALNGDTINATMYLILSHIPSLLHGNSSSMGSPSLYYTEGCYGGHQTLQAESLWKKSETWEEGVSLTSIWVMTLEKNGCHHMIRAGADGIQQAMLLSFGALRFSNHHLEFSTHPNDLHRDYFFRRINYGNGTHVNISVVVGDDNVAVLHASLDRKDREYWACDAGCMDPPIQLGPQWKEFPVKLTHPVTPVLYITSDKAHMEVLKHTIHVKEVKLAPAHDHHVMSLHRHGHQWGGLPPFFWAALAFLVVVFHLFLFKLIYNEYWGSGERLRIRLPVQWPPEASRGP
ncbi:unnamed protein product [Darwinula stevensoni]|uniref:Mos1 transposase HTH domain-containing protein n=1 Tax=Darwinula stevensoni TaxID=69355 RepID=A0A7R8XA14_9CRUS|nr:unnamed protein product [Darwinula stevensoni]CAG0883181.1 unnamed protein product [Darwinula stevensoni]